MRKPWGLLCVILIACTATLVIPGVAAADDSSSYYNPKRLEFGVMNAAMFHGNIPSHLRNQWAAYSFNRFGYFKRDDGNSYVIGAVLTRPYVKLTMSMGPGTNLPVVDTLRTNGHLQLMMRGTFKNVSHKGSSHSNSRTDVTAYALMNLYQGNTLIAARKNGSTGTSEVAVGDDAWFSPHTEPGEHFKLWLTTSAWPNYLGCNCGDAVISNMAVAFRDVTGPSLRSVYSTSDPDGNVPDTTFKAGETLYIHLEFNEYVRLSDNSWTLHQGAPLKLDIANIAGTQTTGADVTAHLYRIKDNRVTFAYEVPPTLTINNNPVTTNHYIIGISADQPGLLVPESTHPDNKFTLTLLGADGHPYDPQSFSKDPSILNILTKTTSLITDLAGNPVGSFKCAFGSDKLPRIDNVPPTVEAIEVVNSAGSTKAGPDDSLTISVRFSEPLNVSDLTQVRATVNLKQGGNYVTTTAESLSLDEKGRTTVKFSAIDITAAMVPESARINNQDEYCLCVTSISPDGVADTCGNSYDGSVAEAPDQEVYVDTLSPFVTTEVVPGDSGYRPVAYEPQVSGTGSYFYFPFGIQDRNEHGDAYVSGVEQSGLSQEPQGKFAWFNNPSDEGQYRFEWAVTASPLEPESHHWKPGLTWGDAADGEEKYPFAQIPGTQYLHIKLNDSAPYGIWDSKLVFYAEDQVGNKEEEEFLLEYIADQVGPSFACTGYLTDYDAGSGLGSITANIEISDPSKVRPYSIYYQWVQRGQNPSVSERTKYEVAGDEATTLACSITIDGLQSERVHELDLYLWASDDIGQESRSQAFPFQLDLTFPGYDLKGTSERASVNPVFKATPPSPHPTDGTPSTMIVMIKDPLDMDGDKYFVRTLNSSRGWGLPGSAPPDDDLLAELLWTAANQYYDLDSDLSKRLGSWRYVRLIKDDDFTLYDGSVTNVEYGFASTEDPTGLADDLYTLILDQSVDWTEPNPRIAAAQRLMAIMDGKYYGEIEVTVITGYGATGRDTWQEVEIGSGVYDVNHTNRANFVNEAAYYWASGDEVTEGYYYDRDLQHKYVPRYPVPEAHKRESIGYFVSYIPQGAIVNAQTWTLNAAANSVCLVQEPNGLLADYQPTGYNRGNELIEYNLAELSLPYSCEILPENDALGGVSPWASPDNGPRYVSSIDREAILVTLSNSIMPSWGVEDIDFTSPDTYLALSLSSSPESGATPRLAYKTSLAPQSVQKLTIPEVTKYSGHYVLTVSIKAKASGAIKVFSYDDIYVDRMDIGEFGLARVDSEMTSDLFNRTDTVWYGFDSDQNSGADYDLTPALRLGNAVSVPGEEFPASLTRRLFFTAKTEGVPDDDDPNVRYGDLFIKVWNATGGPEASQQGKATARWVPIARTCDTGIKAVIVGSLDSINESSYVDTDGTPTVPLVLPSGSGQAGFQNVLQYQVVSSNGKESALRTLLVTVSNETAEFEVEIDPDDDPLDPDFVVDHTMAKVAKLQSSIPKPLGAYSYRTESDTHTAIGGDAIRLSDSGTYWFYAVNAYGNYKFVKKVVDFVDGTPPVVTDVYHAQFPDHFELEYRITDNYMPDGVIPEGLSFYMRFGPSASEDPGDPPDPDADYMESLGYERYEFAKINLPDYASAGPGDPDPVWVATEPSPIGVYEATAKRDGFALLVHLKGVFKYDDQKAYWQAITRQIQVYAEDAAGNRSSIVSDSATMQNITPHFRYYGMEPPRDSITYERGSAGDTTNVKAEFNIPVILHEPRSRVASPEFSTVKDQLLIYRDEYSHLFLFTDIFGDYHEKFANVLCIGNDSLDVTFSTTEPTSGSVVVDIRVAMPESGLTFSAWKGSVGDDENLIASNTDSVSVEVVENTTIHCMLWPDTASARLVQIPVTNIYKSPPVADVLWYYEEFLSEDAPPGVEQTTAPVTAYLVSLDERPIYPVGGTSGSHTFTYGDLKDSSYTFRFRDQAGNTGSLDVYLPVDIVEPTVPEDNTAPQYHLNVYGWNQFMGSWSTIEPIPPNHPANFDEVLADISWTSGYLLEFDRIKDESATKVLVLPGTNADISGLTYDGSTGETVPGVSVEGREVYVDGAVLSDELTSIDFTVVIIDQKDNKSALSVSAGSYLDAVPPRIEIHEVKTDFYRTRVYIELSDNKSMGETLLSPTGLPVGDPGSGYDGQPYIDFQVNDSVEVVAEDAARNRATLTVTVGDLDTSAPVSQVLWWSPCYVEYVDGGYMMDPLLPPKGDFNKDIQVCLGFNKIIQSISVSIPGVPDAQVGNYVTYELLGDRAILTFVAGVPDVVSEVAVQFTAQNGKSGNWTMTYPDDFDFRVDKTPPGITVTSENDLPNKASVRVTFTVDNEPVKMDDDTEYNPGQQIVKTIAARGTFAYRFVDKAGNVTVKEIEVRNIDVEPPVIMVMGEDNGGAYKKGSHTFYATLNEAGTITFQGVSQTVANPDPTRNAPLDKLNIDDIGSGNPDCDWKALTVTKNGTYQIEATDNAGRKSFTYVTVSCLDNTPPVIAFSQPATASVVEGTTREALEDMLDDFAGIVATDNVTPRHDIQLALDVSGAVLDRPGFTTVVYTATDQAGNQRVTSRDVRVYSANEIAVSVNGVKTEPQSTTVLPAAAEFTLTIENLAAASEPVKIYLRPGRFTAGQMKSDASRIDTTFTVSGQGYYTLYIVSQSRQAYLTYLYIQ